MSVALTAELGTVAGLIAAAGILVGGLIWLIRRVMGLGVWLGSITANTSAVKDLTKEITTLRYLVEDNSRRLAQVERKVDKLDS